MLRKRGLTGEAGYSLMELMIAMTIASALSAMALLQISNTRDVVKGDAAMRVVLGLLNRAQMTAIQQRKYVEIVFDTTNNQMSLVREDTTSSTSSLVTIGFEGGAKYALISGASAATDTPDAFGNTAATSFTSQNGTFASKIGTTTLAKFAPDGTLVDWNGRTTNGTIFLALANNAPMSVRAATILGSTGRIRGYRWNGRNWTRV